MRDPDDGTCRIVHASRRQKTVKKLPAPSFTCYQLRYANTVHSHVQRASFMGRQKLPVDTTASGHPRNVLGTHDQHIGFPRTSSKDMVSLHLEVLEHEE